VERTPASDGVVGRSTRLPRSEEMRYLIACRHYQDVLYMYSGTSVPSTLLVVLPSLPPVHLDSTN
jgi:hypothetical protein